MRTMLYSKKCPKGEVFTTEADLEDALLSGEWHECPLHMLKPVLAVNDLDMAEIEVPEPEPKPVLEKPKKATPKRKPKRKVKK